MYETMEKVKEICEMRDHIEENISNVMKTGNFCKLTAEEAGEMIDMVKDLYEAEEKAWKACYYKKIVEGMEPPTEEERRRYHEGPMGYDNWRYSSRRYAPKGHGHRSGYVPDQEIYDVDDMDHRSMDPNRWMRPGMTHMQEMDDRYGRAYNQWKNARKHYTESKSMTDKEEMERHAKEHMKDAYVSIKEMYMNADPELRKEIKKDLTALIGEMPA